MSRNMSVYMAEERRVGVMWVVWSTAAFIAISVAWASHAVLEEVTSGSGVVVPSSREQLIQSLAGGVLSELLVREGDVVEAGQILAVLDPTVSGAEMEEIAARYRATLARMARLQAEVSGDALIFPDALADYPELRLAEESLYIQRQENVRRATSLIQQSLSSLREEQSIISRLVESGASSNVELLRLRRDINEHEIRLEDIDKQYRVAAQEELSKNSSEAESLSHAVTGKRDAFIRTVLRSPVNGVVQDVDVTTIGGVIAPNGRLMTIVPRDDQLLVEVKVKPRDIAFIHPGQPAKVKVTAYDYSIFGGLEGEVVTISPDTIRDEIAPEEVYYRVLVRTDSGMLSRNPLASFSISPGMQTVVDIRTGSKTVMHYLLKPINKAKEALRER